MLLTIAHSSQKADDSGSALLLPCVACKSRSLGGSFWEARGKTYRRCKDCVALQRRLSRALGAEEREQMSTWNSAKRAEFMQRHAGLLGPALKQAVWAEVQQQQTTSEGSRWTTSVTVRHEIVRNSAP